MTSTETADWNLMAAEYVLRLLPAKEEDAFEERMMRDSSLREQVAHWVAQFQGMDDEFGAVKPRRKVKSVLMSRLFDGNTLSKPTIWQRVWLWQGVSFAAVALAAFISLQSFSPELPSQSGTGFVAEIAAENESLRMLAVFQPSSGTIQITRTAGAAFENRVLELWAIDGDSAPVSLGVLPEQATAAVVLPEHLQNREGLILAVSDEPVGGSPTGAPTGAVLAAGSTHEI